MHKKIDFNNNEIGNRNKYILIGVIIAAFLMIAAIIAITCFLKKQKRDLRQDDQNQNTNNQNQQNTGKILDVNTYTLGNNNKKMQAIGNNLQSLKQNNQDQNNQNSFITDLNRRTYANNKNDKENLKIAVSNLNNFIKTSTDLTYNALFTQNSNNKQDDTFSSNDFQYGSDDSNDLQQSTDSNETNNPSSPKNLYNNNNIISNTIVNPFTSTPPPPPLPANGLFTSTNKSNIRSTNNGITNNFNTNANNINTNANNINTNANNNIIDQKNKLKKIEERKFIKENVTQQEIQDFLTENLIYQTKNDSRSEKNFIEIPIMGTQQKQKFGIIKIENFIWQTNNNEAANLSMNIIVNQDLGNKNSNTYNLEFLCNVEKDNEAENYKIKILNNGTDVDSNTLERNKENNKIIKLAQEPKVIEYIQKKLNDFVNSVEVEENPNKKLNYNNSFDINLNQI